MNKIVKTALPALVLVLLVVAWVAPIGPMPGIFIGGTATPVPADWGDTSGIDEVRVEAPGGIPRVVIVWVIQVDGELHVVGSSDSGWVKKLGQGGPVRLRMEGKTYALEAERLNGDNTGILTAYADKYRPNYPDIVESFGDVEEAAPWAAVFRLGRPAGS